MGRTGHFILGLMKYPYFHVDAIQLLFQNITNQKRNTKKEIRIDFYLFPLNKFISISNGFLDCVAFVLLPLADALLAACPTSLAVLFTD